MKIEHNLLFFLEHYRDIDILEYLESKKVNPTCLKLLVYLKDKEYFDANIAMIIFRSSREFGVHSFDISRILLTKGTPVDIEYEIKRLETCKYESMLPFALSLFAYVFANKPDAIKKAYDYVIKYYQPKKGYVSNLTYNYDDVIISPAAKYLVEYEKFSYKELCNLYKPGDDIFRYLYKYDQSQENSSMYCFLYRPSRTITDMKVLRAVYNLQKPHGISSYDIYRYVAALVKESYKDVSDYTLQMEYVLKDLPDKNNDAFYEYSFYLIERKIYEFEAKHKRDPIILNTEEFLEAFIARYEHLSMTEIAYLQQSMTINLRGVLYLYIKTHKFNEKKNFYSIKKPDHTSLERKHNMFIMYHQNTMPITEVKYNLNLGFIKSLLTDIKACLDDRINTLEFYLLHENVAFVDDFVLDILTDLKDFEYELKDNKNLLSLEAVEAYFKLVPELARKYMKLLLMVSPPITEMPWIVFYTKDKYIREEIFTKVNPREYNHIVLRENIDKDLKDQIYKSFTKEDIFIILRMDPCDKIYNKVKEIVNKNPEILTITYPQVPLLYFITHQCIDTLKYKDIEEKHKRIIKLLSSPLSVSIGSATYIPETHTYHIPCIDKKALTIEEIVKEYHKRMYCDPSSWLEKLTTIYK